MVKVPQSHHKARTPADAFTAQIAPGSATIPKAQLKEKRAQRVLQPNRPAQVRLETAREGHFQTKKR